MTFRDIIAKKKAALIGGSEPQHDYSQDYFTVNITANGSLSWWRGNSANISYRKNGGAWSTVSSDYVFSSLQIGDTIELKGNNASYNGCSLSSEDSPCTYTVSGNIMSLCYGDNFQTATQLLSDYAFPSLLYYSNGITSAENLILPATTLTRYCYAAMFYYCPNLTTGPLLPASVLEEGCYQQMFASCSSLSSITCLATDISARNCVSYWVDGVGSTGTFKKAASMTGWGTGRNGIPSGWTVQNYVS